MRIVYFQDIEAPPNMQGTVQKSAYVLDTDGAPVVVGIIVKSLNGNFYFHTKGDPLRSRLRVSTWHNAERRVREIVDEKL